MNICEDKGCQCRTGHLKSNAFKTPRAFRAIISFRSYGVARTSKIITSGNLAKFSLSFHGIKDALEDIRSSISIFG